MKRALLVITLIALLGSTAQAAVTITSTVNQSGQTVYPNPLANITAAGGWDFTSQAYNDLTSIDEITVTVIPVILGEGIPLFGPLERDVQLTHVRTQAYDFGFVQTTYRVRNLLRVRPKLVSVLGSIMVRRSLPPSG